ncbi:MAG: hypothetical protein ACK56K_13500, partial [Akkermansiaceae bacterium]
MLEGNDVLLIIGHGFIAQNSLVKEGDGLGVKPEKAGFCKGKLACEPEIPLIFVKMGWLGSLSGKWHVEFSPMKHRQNLVLS